MSSAADAAPRSRWSLHRHAAGPARSAPCPTTSCWPRSAGRSTSRRSSARATRKLCARLRLRGIHTGRKRVLRLTREAGLLAPTPQVRKRSRRLHDATITVTVPDTLWRPTPPRRTPAARGAARCSRSSITPPARRGSTIAPRMDRWAAADLLREVTTERFSGVRMGTVTPERPTNCYLIATSERL